MPYSVCLIPQEQYNPAQKASRNGSMWWQVCITFFHKHVHQWTRVKTYAGHTVPVHACSLRKAGKILETKSLSRTQLCISIIDKQKYIYILGLHLQNTDDGKASGKSKIGNLIYWKSWFKRKNSAAATQMGKIKYINIYIWTWVFTYSMHSLHSYFLVGVCISCVTLSKDLD